METKAIISPLYNPPRKSPIKELFMEVLDFKNFIY